MDIVQRLLHQSKTKELGVIVTNGVPFMPVTYKDAAEEIIMLRRILSSLLNVAPLSLEGLGNQNTRNEEYKEILADAELALKGTE
jgi:hypothetical protein